MLTANLLVRILVAIRPLEYLDGLTIPDDAYLSLTIARNIANGLGPLYGLDFTNGFQPLYVFFMAPVYLIFPGDPQLPVHAALILLILFDTLSLLVLYRFVTKLSRNSLTPVIAAVAWVFNPYIIGTTLNGLETSISVFFALTVLYLFHRRRADYLSTGTYSPKRAFVLGLVLGIALLARIDNLFLAVAIGIVSLWDVARGRFEAAAFLKTSFAICAGAVLVYSPWIAYSFIYTGDIYQVSGKAVRFMSLADVNHAPTWINWYWPVLWKASGAIWRNNFVLLYVMGAFIVLLAFRRKILSFQAVRERVSEYITVSLFSLCLFMAYAFYVFAPWFFDRYLFPIVLMLLLCGSLLIDLFISAMVSRRRQLVVGLVLMVLIAVAGVVQPRFQALYRSTDKTTMGYMNLGVWAEKSFPDGTVVGCSQTGALGYFADNLLVINLDGVVNKACFESLTEMRNMDYIRETKIQYIIGWPANLDFIANHSAAFKPNDLILMTKIPGFKSWGAQWYLYRVHYIDPKP